MNNKRPLPKRSIKLLTGGNAPVRSNLPEVTVTGQKHNARWRLDNPGRNMRLLGQKAAERNPNWRHEQLIDSDRLMRGALHVKPGDSPYKLATAIPLAIGGAAERAGVNTAGLFTGWVLSGLADEYLGNSTRPYYADEEAPAAEEEGAASEGEAKAEGEATASEETPAPSNPESPQPKPQLPEPKGNKNRWYNKAWNYTKEHPWKVGIPAATIFKPTRDLLLLGGNYAGPVISNGLSLATLGEAPFNIPTVAQDSTDIIWNGGLGIVRNLNKLIPINYNTNSATSPNITTTLVPAPATPRDTTNQQQLDWGLPAVMHRSQETTDSIKRVLPTFIQDANGNRKAIFD